MPGYSAHYHLIELNAGDNLSEDDYAFTQRNIENIDSKLYLGAEAHKHDGLSATVANPDTAPGVLLTAGIGNIPGARTVRYKFTWVSPNNEETAASPERTITTPAPISVPGTPIIVNTTGGTLLPGNYFYLLTAYKDANTLETTPSPRAYATLAFGSGLKTVEITFPTLPASATGFNIYRRSPGSMRFQWLTSVAVDVATPPEGFTDTGALTEDCNRTTPVRNTTGTQNSIEVSIPGATPTIPDGYTWKLYRTYTANDWDSSLLHWVVEEVSEDSGIITTTFTDVGQSTSSGTPPQYSELAGSPSKILLTDGTEAQGSLPAGLNIVPQVVTFTFPGPLEVVEGNFIWVCEFTKASIMGCRGALGIDSTPVFTDVIVDINKWDGAVFTTIYTNQDNRPKVLIGEQLGIRTVPDITALVEGDMLSVDVDQIGGSATPTDYNLVVNIYMLVQGGSQIETHIF